MALKVNEQSPAVVAMAKSWPIAAALLGGTQAMRDAKGVFLPRQPREEVEDWEYRLSVATLFPAWERTLNVMSGKPFAKQLTFGEDVPKQIVAWCDDCDLEGRNLHTFASEMLAEALGFGLAGVLVDYPRVGPEVKTLAAEQAIGARPYLVKIEHDQILGWKAKRVNGVMTLVQLRIAETAEEDDGGYGSAVVNRVRVLTPGKWELWQQPKEGADYVLVEEGETSLNAIPFVPFYGRRTGFMAGISPLMNLAHMNVEHWQESSDQKDSTRFARKRMLVISGVDNQGEITAGSNYAMQLPQGGDAKIVQGSAESVTVGRSEIDALEDRMIQAGAELLVPQTGQRTATEANNDAEANKSELQRIVEQFEDSLDQCLQFMAEWSKQPEGGHTVIHKDFSASSLTDASAQLVVAMQQGGLITKETALREQQRRGIISPNINPLDELEKVDAEGPALGAIDG